uniref:Integrase catalytic domain-containing protein n=1 Tax=Cacopsylla melanoneura TaxID=428564 RepID=A0A8D9B3Q3_9HEMI
MLAITEEPPNLHSFHVYEKRNNVCVFCNGSHSLPECNAFLKISPQDRYRVAKDNSLCVNCLVSQHKASECSLKLECTICSLKHNTLLHFHQNKNSNNFGYGKTRHATFSKPSTSSGVPVSGNSGNKREIVTPADVHNVDQVFSSLCAEPEVSKNLVEESHGTTVLLSTVKALVFDSNGEARVLRFLLDSGSMCNLLTKTTCQQLNLDIGQSNTLLSGIGSNLNPVQGQVLVKMRSMHDDRINFSVKALVVDHIVDTLPVSHIDCSKLDYIENIVLADNDFMKPGSIAGILGASIYSYLFDGKTIMGKEGQPAALSTKLGYVLMGNAPILKLKKGETEFCMFQKTQLENNLEKFWELDQVNVPYSKLTPDEQKCEEHYTDSFQRDPSGRYQVSLPFAGDTSQLGHSFDMARKRFLNLEKKLDNNSQYKEDYSKGMQDLIEKNYMVKSGDQEDRSGYFIPHHMVAKLDSVSTKLRIVFDASAGTTSGKSLNDILYTGPKLYSDLLGILLNFRLFVCAINGDITKMFLQIMVNDNDCNYQKLLWRFSSCEPLTIYEMKVVIFGMRSSPYLAQRTVRHLFNDEIVNYPGATGILESLYMDDCVASFPSVEKTKLFYHDVVNLFKSGGFTFTKWVSNSMDVMNDIPESDQLTKLISFDSGNDKVKILGMLWDARGDFLHFKFAQFEKPCTKRGILSAVLTIYDPMGLLAPIVFWVKLLIRELCTLKLDWDSTPPPNVVSSWQLFRSQLPMVECLQFPRHIGVVVDCDFQLIGFSDSSSQGYGAVIYSRVKLPDGNIVIELVCSRSKVAPLQAQSIPRLELCGILLLSNLMKSIMDSYSVRYKIENYFGFTDSTVALCWVHGSPHLWNVFVANRVSKVQSNLDCKHIYHVNGSDNPADCLSRGELPAQFVENKLYFHGPSWLSQDVSLWPLTSYENLKNSEVPERKSNTTVLVAVSKTVLPNPFNDLFLRVSSWSKLLVTMVYILRFLKKLPRGGSISVHDLEVAEICILKQIQRDHFGDEMDKIVETGECGKTLCKLSPFIDNNILRVGGRLSNSNLPNDQQHPILLPASDHVTELIVTHWHLTNFHTGPFLLLALLRQKYWIVGGRNLVRKIVQKCNVCFKLNPKFNCPKMGDLPAARVIGLKAFYHTACDFLGPINIVMERKRGGRSVKAYVCLFICLATKAIHLEVVADLSTSAFMNSLKRFLSRRGPIKSMLSDNGTNFVGAKNHLDGIYSLLNSDEYKQAFAQEMLENRIEWKFNPPLSPHFGGIFESNVKSFKTHFLKVIGTQLLTYEEFLTCTVEIEGLLNSRPLCVMSSDPADCRSLTPNHFLNLTDLKHIPANYVANENPNRLTRFQLLDHIVQSFWRRWSNEYLTELQVRHKWNLSIKNLEPGIVVIIKQENCSPLMWPVGVITEVFPGKDGVVRVASVRTSRGVYQRPVCKLAPLPTQ